MQDNQTVRPDCPVLAVAYDATSLAALVASLGQFGASAVPCASFCEAESHALVGKYRGILVDLATIIKAKAEEKIVAYTLMALYPSLRVKTMGAMLIPMVMPGDARQDKSLNDFLTKSCALFTPRPLRSNKRKDLCLPTYIDSERGFTLNISWSGVFIASMDPERFSLGQELAVTFADFGISEVVVVTNIRSWGERRPSGIGAKFKQLGPELACQLAILLKSNKDTDRDRMTT